MRLCRCTDDAAAQCCGGGLPPTDLGHCSCDCHRPVLRERWPLATPEAPATDLARRVRVYELALHAPDVLIGLHAQIALDVCGLLAQLPPKGARVTAASIGAAGCAEPLVAALVRLALLSARSRVTAGLRAGGVP